MSKLKYALGMYFIYAGYGIITLIYLPVMLPISVALAPITLLGYIAEKYFWSKLN